MIAALPMYDRPETRAATDRLWALIRTHLGTGPARLTRGRDPWRVWTDPDLTLAQTCGLPYRTRLHGRVTLVGTPDYDLPDCPPGYYHSVLVAHRDAPADLTAYSTPRLAYNDPLSQSGWAAPIAHAESLGLRFADFLHTGSHTASARAVAVGDADLAALDAVSWALMQRYDAFAAALRVIDRTRPTPGLPLIAAGGADGAARLAATRSAIDALAPEDRETLHLRGIEPIPAEAYLALPTPPPPDMSPQPFPV